MLVETANIFNNFNFKWPAGLHLWSNSKGSSSSSSTTATITTTTSWTTVFLSTSWSIGLLVPASLVLCWRNMTTEYSSPYKVGLIDVDTKFAQSRLAWSAIAYGKLNFRGTVEGRFVVRTKCKLCTTPISPSNNSVWHKVRGVFFLC